jgi:hypothetical protein
VSTLAVAETLRHARWRGRSALAVALVIAAVFSVSQLVERGRSYRDNVRTPLCVVAEREGETMNGMADVLGLAHPSAGVIDLGGQALTSRLRLIDLGGLGTRETADLLKTVDMAWLRDYTFNRARPGFITLIGTWDTTIGFPTDPRFQRDYHLVHHSPAYQGTSPAANYVGYWVRKDVVTDPELRAYTQARLPGILDRNTAAPRRSCGATLAPGQT